jgi:F-type H+-transporting ATPase subunit b
VLQHELQQKRSRAIEELRKTLDAEREKADAIEQRRQREFEEDRQRVALGLGARFAARLLKALSGPELDDRILELACGQLARLTGEPRAALRRAFTNGGSEILVECAHTISPDQRRKLEQALGELLGGPPSCRYAEQPQLIAGLRLSMGDWTLGANLNDEVKGFAEQAHGLG